MTDFLLGAAAVYIVAGLLQARWAHRQCRGSFDAAGRAAFLTLTLTWPRAWL